jgi:hypothetical protein
MNERISNDKFVASAWRGLYQTAAGSSFGVRMARQANRLLVSWAFMSIRSGSGVGVF